MIFKAKKVMKFEEYLQIEEKLKAGNIKVIGFMIYPAEVTANRIEVVLKIEV